MIDFIKKWFLLNSLALAFFACNGDNSLAGGVSEETNTLAGVLMDASGRGVAGVRVSARYMHYDGSDVMDTTDSAGHFEMVMPMYGDFGLSAQTDSLAYYEKLHYNGVGIYKEAVLQTARSVSGNIGGRQGLSFVNVEIPGSIWSTKTDVDGDFVLENVPEGIFYIYAKTPDFSHYENASYVISVDSAETRFYGPIVESIVDSIILNDDFEDEEVDASELDFPLAVNYGIRSWWSMDSFVGDVKKTAKTIKNDVKDNMVDSLVVYGKVSLENGVVENALLLDGANQYGFVEDDRVLNSTSEMLLETWLSVDSILTDDAPYRMNVIGKMTFGNHGSNHGIFSLAVINDECGVSSPTLAFFLANQDDDSLSCENVIVAQETISIGKWVYVSVVWNGETLKLYLDGKVSSRKELKNYEKLADSSDPIFFGKQNLRIRLDEVKIGVKSISDIDVFYRYNLKGGLK